MTARLHLSTGVPWSGRLGAVTGRERDPRRQVLPSLPRQAPVIADAGFHGADLAAAILAAKGSFLIRMSWTVRLFVPRPVDRAGSHPGWVMSGPLEARRAQGRRPGEICLVVGRREPGAAVGGPGGVV